MHCFRAINLKLSKATFTCIPLFGKPVSHVEKLTLVKVNKTGHFESYQMTGAVERTRTSQLRILVSVQVYTSKNDLWYERQTMIPRWQWFSCPCTPPPRLWRWNQSKAEAFPWCGAERGAAAKIEIYSNSFKQLLRLVAETEGFEPSIRLTRMTI